MTLELTEQEIELITLALEQKAFKEAEIAINLGLPNTQVKVCMQLAEKIKFIKFCES